MLLTMLFFLAGVGLVGAFKPLPSNSAFFASAGGQLGRLTCHSANTMHSIGRWFDSNGQDISFNPGDIQLFNVDYATRTLHSYTSLEVRSGHNFTADNEGIYSCVIPDEEGDSVTLNVGLYSNSYNSESIISGTDHSLLNNHLIFNLLCYQLLNYILLGLIILFELCSVIRGHYDMLTSFCLIYLSRIFEDLLSRKIV